MSAVVYDESGTTAHLVVEPGPWGCTTHEGLLAGIERAATSRDVLAILVSGGSDFGVQADTDELAGADPGRLRHILRTMASLPEAIRMSGKPVVAAIRGRCHGPANQFQMVCDLTVAADDAVFSLGVTRGTESRALLGGQWAPRIVGEKPAREMVLLGRSHGPEAFRGFANEIVPDRHVDATAESVCEEIASLSPASQRMVKASISYGTDLLFSSMWQAVDYEVLARIEKASDSDSDAPPPPLAEVAHETISIERGPNSVQIEFANMSPRELHAALQVAESDPDIRSVILRPGGEFRPGSGREETKAWHGVLVTLRNIAKPTITVVSGEAQGAVTELCLVSDLALATPEARFGMDAVRRAAPPPAWGSQLLGRVVFERRARTMGLLGRTMDAHEAQRWGLVNWIVDGQELGSFVDWLIAECAELDPVGVQMAKAGLNFGANTAYPSMGLLNELRS